MGSTIVACLAEAAHTAASADNSQPWHLMWDGNYLDVRFRKTGNDGLSPDPGNTATLLAIGGVIENIIQMGTRLGLDLASGLDIMPGGDSATYARIPVDNQEVAQGAHNDHPLFNRHTNRFRFQKTPLPDAVKSELEAMREGSAHLQLFDNSVGIGEIADLIKAASGVRFRVREAHEWLAASLRFGNETASGDGGMDSGMDISTLSLPPGGAQLLRLTRSWRVMSVLNRLGVHRFMAAADTTPVYAAPALVAIKASPGKSGAIEAGRLLTRIWNRLNEQNIAVHPYYAITDQLARLEGGTLPGELRDEVMQIRDQCNRYCALSQDSKLYMILRVGFPVQSAPKSRRVPLANVFSDLSTDKNA